VDEQRSWYQPLREAGAIERAMRFVLAEDGLFLNTSSDTRLMSEMLAAADNLLDRDVVPPTADELAADVATFDMQPLFDGAELERI